MHLYNPRRDDKAPVALVAAAPIVDGLSIVAEPPCPHGRNRLPADRTAQFGFDFVEELEDFSGIVMIVVRVIPPPSIRDSCCISKSAFV
jgi:hypothetical protein